MKVRLIIRLVLILLGSSKCITAQVQDAQLWENIGIEKYINPRLYVHVIQQGRISENYSLPHYNDFDMGINYKINKHVHAAFAYVWGQKKKWNNDYWSTRQQAYFDLTFREKFKGFLFCDRQMVSGQVVDYFTSINGKIPTYYLRNKLTIRYEKNFRLAPYIASEIYYNVNGLYDNWQYRFNHIRYFAGVFYRPDSVNEFEIYYLIDNHINTKTPTLNWVIGLGYTFCF